MKLARNGVSKTLIREQKVFATLPFDRRFGFCWRLNCEMNFIQLHRRPPPPPYDTKLLAKFHRSRSSWKRAEMREAATALRYAETTSWMVILRGRAENRLVCSLFLLYVLFWISLDEMYDSPRSLERVETHYSSEE